MKKLVALIALLTLGVTAVAFAQGQQTNEYKVSFKVTPKPKSSTKKNPMPVGLNVSWDVTEQSGLRPAVVKTYSVGIFGGTTNGKFFPTCTAQQINNAGSDEGCPAGARIGSGRISNAVGAASDLKDTSIPCEATHTIYNSGQGRAAIFIEGAPPSCAVSLATAIDARFVKIMGGKGTAMQFDVPENLRHPVNGLDLAVTKVTANLPKKTTKVKGKTRGFWEVVDTCPKSRKAPVEFEFTTEAGTSTKVDSTVACKP
jgi:hypothetical protein